MTETLYELEWNNFWKEIIIDSDGNINLEQVKKELADYKNVMQNNVNINMYMTNGMLSEAYYPEEVIHTFHDLCFIDKKIAKDDIINIVEDGTNISEIIEKINKYLS